MGYTLLFALGVVALIWVLNHSSKVHQAHARQLILENRQVAAFMIFDQGVPPLPERLQLRATSNQRLASVFSIENSFTTTDITHHRCFLNQAAQAIQSVDKETWARLFGVATDAVQLADGHVRFKNRAGASQVPLARLVRVVTFRTVIDLLFHVDSAKIAIDDIVTVTENINELWMRSKDGFDGIVSPNDLHRLQTALHRILPEAAYPFEPRTDPLNIIMPAYETMWRVVLLTFVAAAFRTRDIETVNSFRLVTQQVPGCLGDSDEEKSALTFAKV